MPTPTTLSDYLSTLSPDQTLVAEALLKHDWFKDTESTLQQEILALPKDYQGFLEDLALRPDEIGELDILRLTKIGYGNFLILLVFEVRSNITNQIFTCEYASWKTGSRPGARGIIFLETNGKITHFLVSKTHKFSSANEVLESVGGLYLHIFDNSIQNLPKKIEQEICFHLGLQKLNFKKIYNLGKAHPDFGMTNNVSDLFAAIIDISDIPNLTTKDDFRQTHKPTGFELKIVHISEFKEYLNKIEDNYFLSAAARILASNDFSLNI